jgi:UDP-MurNAc hydroxylase
MRVRLIGHAALLCETRDARIIMDPWIVGPSNLGSWWHLPAIPPDVAALPPVDFIYISHMHDDHFHAATLKTLAREPTVLVPRLYHPRLVRQLRRLGYRRIRELPHWGEVHLGGETRLCCTHVGRDSVVVVTDGERSMLNANDALQGDAAKLGLRTLRELGQRYRLDVAFLAFGTAGPFPKCYRFEDPAETMAPELKERAMLANFAAGARAAGAPVAVPFAGGFALLAERLLWMNEVKSTPRDALEFLARREPGLQGVEMNPGDIWDDREGLITLHPPVDWDRRLETIRSMHAQHVAELRRIDAEERLGPRDLPARLERRLQANAMAARFLGRRMEGRFLIQVEGEPGGSWEVNLNGAHATVRQGDSGDWSVRLRIPARLLAAVLENPDGWETLAISYKLDLFFRKGTRRLESTLDRLMYTPSPVALVRMLLTPRFAAFAMTRRHDLARMLKAKLGR